MMRNFKLKFIFLMLLIPIFTFAELEVIPNPFNSDSETATIRFTTPSTSDVTIAVYDIITNQILRRLYTGIVLDEIQIPWDGKGDYGNLLDEGSYIVKAYKDQYSVSYNPVESIIHYGSDAAYNNERSKVIVVNTFGHQVEIFNAVDGSLFGRYGQFGTGSNDLYFPLGCAVDEDNWMVYVSDASGTIKKLDGDKFLGGDDFEFEEFYKTPSGDAVRGMNFFGKYLYASVAGDICKFDTDGNILNMLDLNWDIPDVCAAQVGTNTLVYFIVNSSGPNPLLFRIEDVDDWSNPKTLTNIPVGELIDPKSEWSSISYDHMRSRLFLLYNNSTDKKFGIRVINPFTETLRDQFEFSEISTTGVSIAAVSTIMVGPTSVIWVPGLNVLNGFQYTSLVPGGGTLESMALYGNPSAMFLWLGDTEVCPGNFIFSADRGFYPEPNSNIFGLLDFESLNIFTGTSSVNFGKWGVNPTELFEPRGVGALYNHHEQDVYFYVVNRSSPALANYGKILRYESNLDTVIDYFTPRTIENPTGLDAFYTWLVTIENDYNNNQSRILMIDTYINSPAAIIPTEFAQSEYRAELNDPIDVAIDYVGRIYALNSDSVQRFALDYEALDIIYLGEFADPLGIPHNSYKAIAVDDYGKVYAYRDDIGKIFVFNADGDLLTRLGEGKGWTPRKFNRVEGMNFDSNGNLWVTDSGNHRYNKIVLGYHGIETEIVTITDNVGIPYVSLFSLSREEPVIAGDLEITIGFSESMDTSCIPEVLMVDGEHGNTHTITQKTYSGNEWKGDITIHPRTGNGMATVLIRNARDLDGHYIEDTERKFKINTDVSDVISNLTNYPNPFSPLKKPTRIEYYLNQHSYVTLEIFDLTGRLVRSQKFSPGQQGGREGFENYFEWDGRTDSGTMIQNGVYILKITAKGLKSGEKKVIKRKIAVMK